MIAWAAVGLTIVVCAVGMRITYLQYGAVTRLILESNRESAQRVRSVVSAGLEKVEGDLLEKLVRDRGERRVLTRTVLDHPVVESPFFVSASGQVRNPVLPRLPPGARMLSEDPMPRVFEEALRRAWSTAPAASKLEELERVIASTSLAEPWRLRASSLVAALHVAEGRPAEAARSYRKLFADFRNTVTESPRPSYLQLTLAYAESLLAANETRELREALSEALALLEGIELWTTTEAELFFLARTRSLFERAGLEPPQALARLDERQSRERRVLAVAASVRDRVIASRRVSGAPSEPPRTSREKVGDGQVYAVWSTLSATAEDGLIAAGFIPAAGALAGEATRILAESGASSLFVVRPRAAAPDESESDAFIHLVPLGAGHDFLEICLPRAEWNQHVGRARRPFLFAGGLIVFLALALITCLVVIQRGVRQELMLSSMKTEFVANVSHELKTPLSLIRMFAETLLLGRVADRSQQEKYYRIITRESERLGHLITNVLNFSSIEAGKKGYQLRPIDLRSVVEEVVESYRFGLEENGFELVVALDDGVPLVEADPEAVSQAVINLLENSIKYSPREKRLKLSVRTVDRRVEVALADRGVGIAPEEQKRVLEDYYRTREARALGTRGSGLGLSVVRHIMEAHSGRLELESEPGRGSCFTLVFPAAASPPTRDGAVPPPHGADPETEEAARDSGKATT